jgi:alkylation response protein AidB-like acyl-CoA dehydrogenase
MNYEAVIGLEVHVQIKTRSKVFTRVGAGYGHEPNPLTDPVVLALPGTLPVMNQAALDAIDEKSNDIRALASLAKAKAGDVLHLASNEMVQMHGGIGMTDAHDAGLYLKRARVAEATFGGSSYHRDRYAKLGGF